MNEWCGGEEAAGRHGGYAEWGGWMRRQGAVRWGRLAGVLLALWVLSVVLLYPFASSWPFSVGGLSTGSAPEPSPAKPPWTPSEDDVRAGLQWRGQGRDANNKTLVLYVYFEKNQLYKDNLQFFLDVGVHERDDVHYVFVLQGPCSVRFPVWRNVVVYSKENECLDFGGWRYGLDQIGWREGGYRYFVFLNSSVRGPFLPLYVPRTIYWTALFTQLLRESGDGYSDNGPIKLVGMTINCYLNRPHVQSMVWVTDYEALEYLIDKTEVVTCKRSMREAITFGEIALSMKLLAHGWNIGSLAVATRGWDFRVQRGCNANQDPNWKGTYYGISPGVHETIFVKANRNVRPQEVEVYSRIYLQQAQQGKFDGLRFGTRN